MSNVKPKKCLSMPNFHSQYSPSICCPPSFELEEEKKTKTTRFQRVVSFPIQKSQAIKRSSYKTRSSSLPVRLHPIVSNLDDDVASLKNWISCQSPSAMWLSDGSGLILLVLSSSSDLLRHPFVLDPLRKSPVTDSFSDDLMRLADFYDLFRTCLLNLLHLQGETRASLRRRDASRLASAIRAQRRAGCELLQLSYAVQTTVRAHPPYLSDTLVSPDESGLAMLPTSMRNSANILATASAVLFRGLAEFSDDSIASISTVVMATEDHTRMGKVVKVWWVVDLMRWKMRAKRNLGATNHIINNGLVIERKMEEKTEEDKERKMAMERMDSLEEFIRAMEISCEKIFRGLVNARVSLLNLLTPSI